MLLEDTNMKILCLHYCFVQLTFGLLDKSDSPYCEVVTDITIQLIDYVLHKKNVK